MILAADEEGCLSEMLIIASALEVRDPRERPVDKQEAADEAHAKFVRPGFRFLRLPEDLGLLSRPEGRSSREGSCARPAGRTSFPSTACGNGSTSTGSCCNWSNRRD